MSVELKKFQLSHGVRVGASHEDQLTDLRLDQRLHSFSFKPKSAVDSNITVRPIQNGLGIISSLGRMSMVSGTPGREAVGIPSCLNIFSGALDTVSASNRQKRAEQTGDETQATVEKGNKLESCIRAIGGVVGSISCFSQIKCLVGQLPSNSLSVESLAGKVGAFSGMIEDAAFGISYALEAGVCAYRFYETYRFKNSFESAEKELDRDGLTHLVNQLTVNSSSELKKIRSEKQSDFSAFQQSLEESALDALSKKGLQITADKQLSPSDTRIKFKHYFEDLKRLPTLERQLKESYAASMNLTLEECSDFPLCALIGFFVEEIKRGHRQEAKIIRCTNSSVVEAVKGAASRGLQERLKAGGSIAETAKKEYQVLSQNVKDAALANQKAQMMRIAEAVVGFAICLVGVLSLFGVCAAPPLLLSLILVVLAIIVNQSAIRTTLAEGAVGKHDKVYLILISLALIISFATGFGLYLGLHLVGMELIKVIVIGITEIALTGYAFYALNKRAVAWKESHPDLQQFKHRVKAIPPGPLTEEVSDLFNRLSKEDQLAVKEAYQDLPFQTERYRQIDSSYSFGAYFLEQNFTSKQEIHLFQSGVEKALEQCWSAHQENRTQQNLEVALKMQALFEAISRRDKAASIKALNQMYQYSGAFSQVIDNVRYAFKKQESQKQLLQVIESIQKKQNNTGLI